MNPIHIDPFIFIGSGLLWFAGVLVVFLIGTLLCELPGWLRRRRDERAARRILAGLGCPRPPVSGLRSPLLPAPRRRSFPPPRLAVRHPEPLADMPRRAGANFPRR